MKEAAERAYVFPSCSEAPATARKCGLLTDKLFAAGWLEKYVERFCAEDGGEASPACVKQFRDDFFRSLAQRYPNAPYATIKMDCQDGSDRCSTLEAIELQFRVAHNKSVLTSLRRDADDIVEEHRAAQKRAQREREASARRDHEVLAGIAGMFAGFAEGLGAGTSRGSRGSRQVCSSDFQCSFGYHCLKAPNAFDGTCARSVDQYGLPTFDGPRLDSGGAGRPADCWSAVDCPAGFQCTDGRCVK